MSTQLQALNSHVQGIVSVKIATIIVHSIARIECFCRLSIMCCTALCARKTVRMHFTFTNSTRAVTIVAISHVWDVLVSCALKLAYLQRAGSVGMSQKWQSTRSVRGTRVQATLKRSWRQ